MTTQQLNTMYNNCVARQEQARVSRNMVPFWRYTAIALRILEAKLRHNG